MQVLSPKALLFIRDLMYKLFTKNEFEEFLFRIGLEDDYVCSIYNGLNKGRLMFEVLKEFNKLPDKGEPFIYTILKEFFEIYKKRSKSDEYDKVIRILQNDGIQIEGQIIETLAGEIAEPAKEESFLFSKLNELDFKTVIRFLEQSYHNYIQGKYEASNAMTRTALEEIIKIISSNIAESRKMTIPISNRRALKPQPIDYRNFLKLVKFLDGNEFALLAAFYQYGSSKGAHPGLSDESECRLRRFMMIGICLQYIEKYERFLFAPS